MANETNEEKLVEYLRRVAGDLHTTRQRLREVEERAQEPIAIVGMACRYPGGVVSPEGLWDLVASGEDAMGEFPAERGWDLDTLFDPDPDHPGTTYADQGGFLYEADRFDAAFFGISRREALAIDPQQRLLLEVSWEVLERAGIDPTSLKGTPTGVFAGTALPGFGTPHIEASAEGYLVTGNAPSVLSGRVSYTLGLEGPAVTVDTACSSSLVAMHLATQALRQGECTLALAGGVTVMSIPNVFTEFSRQRGLAADGHCKPFAAAADGTAFSEGVGLVLLERLSDAQRNGHRVLAVIRGSAVNQDGASNGLTAPNGPSQQRVIRQALATTLLSPDDVDVVEAHGTGTRLGDPIEAQALLATYGRERPPDQALWLGSVKSNIGHTQGAAGAAGVIKMVMAMQRETLPVTLHVDEPTPNVDWSAGPVRLLTEPVGWRRGERLRRAGVSSFGISGTNAHLILEEAPAPATAEPVSAARPAGLVPWVLAGRGDEALRAQAGALAAHVDAHPELPVTDVAWSLARTRSVFEHRAVVLGEDREALRAGLAAVADGSAHPGVTRATAPARSGGTAFMFTGQGSQRPGMGAELYRAYEVFATAFDDVCAHLDPLLERPLRDVVFATGEAGEDAAALDRTGVTQAALFAVETALFRLVESFGLVPDYLTGHSVGEIVAAHVAGVLSLADACTLVAARGRLMQELPEGGAMVAVEATEERVLPLLAGREDRVALAAVNGPAAVVLSGDADVVEEIAGTLRDQGHKTKRLRVSHAFHSPRLDPMLEEFRQVARKLTFDPPRIPVVSNLTGEVADAGLLTDPEYWVRHVRRPVRFHDGLATLHAEGVTQYLELGPDPVLTTMAQDCLNAARHGTDAVTDAPPAVATVLRKDRDEVRTLLTALAEVHVSGGRVDFSAALPAGAATVVLPTYRFQYERFWRPVPGADVGAAGLGASDHPMLQAVVEQADGGLLLTGRLSLRTHAWLADHAIADGVPLPGTAFLELALAAADRAGCDVVEDLTLEAPLLLPARGAARVQVAVAVADASGNRPVTIYSRPDDDGEGEETNAWHRHAAGILAASAVEPPAPEAVAWPPAGAVPVDVDELYARLADQGYRYGPAFRGVRSAWRLGDEMFAEVRLPSEAATGHGGGYAIHPALLDGALHAVDELYQDEARSGGATGTVRLPFSFSGVRRYATGPTRLRVRITPGGTDALRLTLSDDDGAPVAAVDSLALRMISADRWRSTRAAADHPLYHLDWQDLPVPADRAVKAGTWALVGGPDDLGLTSGPDPVVPDASAHPDLAALRAEISAGRPVPDLVIVPCPRGDADDVPAAVRTATHRVLSLLQEWLSADRLDAARLVIVTSGAVAAGTGDGPSDLVTAPIWGLVRAAQAESPDRILLLDLDDDAASLAALRSALPVAVASAENQLAVRAGTVRVPRLARVVPDQDAETPALDPDGTALITGGTGAVGRVVARHLVTAHGVRHLLLAGRRGAAAEGAAELEAELAGLGASVRIAACDTTDPEALSGLLATIPGAHPLTAVVHAAGVIDDGVVTALTPERLDGVLAPKLDAAWHLHRLTREAAPAAFVLFSSASSILGSGGQASYTAANMFLNALAEHRRAEGRTAVSLAWGLWESPGGMTDHLGDADLARMARSGVAAMPADQALGLLDAALTGRRPTVVAARFDRAALRGQAAAGSLTPPLRGMVRVPVRSAGDRPGASALSARLSALSGAERDAAIGTLVREQVAAVLAHPEAGSIELGRAFQELGFDSLTALELRNRLNAATGITLPATIVFDHPTPGALVRFLRSELLGESSAPSLPAVTGTAADDDPIVIVGMACRYPGGVRTPDDLWDLVASGADAVGEFPADRDWDVAGLFDPDPDRVGRSYTREGGFLYDAARFDAGFFEISPREAVAMDPQQRLLLETAWEAFEHAGIDPATLRGSRTAVMAGVMYDDYGSRFLGRTPEGVEGRLMTGSTPSVVSGRVAYTFGLEGPALTVDTACSSSLVATHLAAQALRQGECTLALAGGVTVMATPNTFVEFSRQRGLAPDGRCKSFAASADGVGWGEGAGLLVLERSSDARRNGHRILAVLRGSAVNQDGASNGLTAPNGPSQQRVIGQALANARLSPADVDAVEAHGTGTTLGDPIEAQALLATYGRDRAEDRPLWLGSVKSNIGHTQAAAGAAGIIKMVMAMRHGVLPGSLHIDAPSPHVNWDAGAVRLLTEPVEWPDSGRPRRTGVSSFGISGTNAHVILEQPAEPVRDEPAPGEDRPAGGVVPWVVSARTAAALRAQAGALAGRMTAGPPLSPLDVGWSLVRARSVFEHRAVVVAEDRDDLVAGLAALAAGEPHPGVIGSGTRAATAGRTVFLFSGQGSQRVGMGAGLYARFPVFAAAFDEVCALLDPHLEYPLRPVVFDGAPQAGLLDHTTYAQAGLFALQVGLARLLESVGVRPEAVVGHSIGEVAAAHIAGVFDLPDACRLVAARATLMGGLPTGGAMAAIEAGADELTDDLGEGVSVAALNTPTSTVISGPAEHITRITADWAAKGRKTKALTVSHAFHSPQMDPILKAFEDAISDLTYRTPAIPLISNLTGLPADEHITTPGYWSDHIAQPVHFHPAITHLAAETKAFLELGPDPVLTTATQHTLNGADPLTVSALTGKRPDVQAFAHALAGLHTAGVDVDWSGWFASESSAQVVELPTYAFQQEHFWLSGGVTADAAGLGLASSGHPLLGAAVDLAGRGTRVLTGRLSRQAGSWLDEHAVAGTVLLPGAALVEWALHAADEAGCAGVEELTLQEPLTLPESGGLRVQVVIEDAAPDGRRTLQVYSRPDEDADAGGPDEWVCHADGVLGPEPGGAPVRLDGAWPPAGAEPLDVAGFYERVAAAGYDYGPVFQGLRAVWRDGADLLAEVTLPDAAGGPGGFGVHPALLDAALHPLFLAHLSGTEPGAERLSLPFAWTGVRLWATGATTVRVRLSPSGSGENGLRVTVADPAGAPVLGVDSLVVRPVSAEQLRGTRHPTVRGLYAVRWTPLAATGRPGEPGDWAVLGADGRNGAAGRYPGLDALTTAIEDGAPVPSIVLAEPGAAAAETDPAGAGRAAAERTLALVREWLAEPRLADARLVVLTRGAVAAGDDEDADGTPPVDLAAAGVWGLVRTAQSENPGRFLLLDLDPETATAAGEVDPKTAVRAAIEADEPQMAIRGTRVLVPRLAPAGAPEELALPAGEPAWRLAVGRAGTLESVSVVPCPEVLEPLKPGQVRVSVRSAGINFRDVLIALGMYPDEGVFAGSEGAGVVADVAPDVTSVSVGDRVVGLFEGAFGPVAVADARMVVPVPEGWSFQQAAAVPVTFLTAWYGLVDLAGLRAGQSVLIHAAAGGVGMAAVRIARHLGAEVYATASPGKHGVLEEMGVDAAHRASSRDLDFEAVVREATGGRGVDVVLNSLAGEFVDASLRLLADGGRFVEMGKTDIRDPEDVGREFPAVSYRAFDLVGDAGADRVGEMLGTLAELFATGALRPQPVRAWPLVRVRQALRTMSQARHTGKLVLDIPPAVDPDGTTLITGGTGTLGALVAEHLVRTGQAGRLLLVGRRGGEAPGAADLVTRLEDLGAHVRIEAADVSDPAAVTGLVAAIDPAHPLTGVIHAAGVIDDAMIASQSPERLARVWETKATAAANLHAATARLPLERFVVFSSAAGTLGSPGQANYAAANAFCDALAAHRRHLGLPGLSVAWGLWAATSAMTGQLTRTDVARMSRTGFTPLGNRHGLALLDAAGRHGAAHLVAVDLDPRALTAGTAPAVLRALAAGGPARPAAGTTPEPADLAGRLAALPRAERRDILLTLVRDQAAAVLGHADSGVIHPDTTFKELGFDSLTVVELRNRLAAATGLRLAASLVFDYPEAGQLADHLHRRLALDDEEPPAEDAVDPILAELGRIEGTLTALSLDEAARGQVTRRLNGLLSALSGGTDAPVGFDGVESASDDEMFELIDREL